MDAHASTRTLEELVNRVKNPKQRVVIGIVGKYSNFKESYKSLTEALVHGGLANDCHVHLEYIDAEELESYKDDFAKHGAPEMLASSDGILVPPGFGFRGLKANKSGRLRPNALSSLLWHMPRHADCCHRVRPECGRHARRK